MGGREEADWPRCVESRNSSRCYSKAVRRATIIIRDDIEACLDTYIRQQDSATLTTLVHAALKEYLVRRGFAPVVGKLRITPAKKGSGARDVSIKHDRYLAGR